MPEWLQINAVATENILKWQVLPALPTWSRLEPMSLTSGDLTPGAQALVADPLWMLGRQWQFDELRGEDGGSPVRATVVGETAPLSRFHATGSPNSRTDSASADDATELDPPDALGALPLEARVEAQIPAVLPLRLRAQAGQQLVRRLRAAGLNAIADAVIAAFSFPPPDDPTDLAAARWRLVNGRIPDGSPIAAACAPLRTADGTLSDVPAAVQGVAGAGDPKARSVFGDWLTWTENQIAAPTGRSWDSARLEHSFQAQADLDDGPVVLSVAEYAGGTLDWFHADLAEHPRLGSAAPVAGAVPVRDTSLPSPVRFAGMPSERLFEFEDAAVYIGGLDAGRTDLARLAVAEFALAYSVDWFQVALVLPYGSVTRLDHVEVVDTFGISIQVQPSKESGSPGWTAFQSTPLTDAGRLSRVFLLAPTVSTVQESLPLEEVALLRDEMANLVWGVEKVVPDRSTGEPIEWGRKAARVSLVQAAPDPELAGDSQLVYRLMTPVPENWIPFVAFREDPHAVHAHHVLERRPMLRFPENGPTELVNPRGTILLTSDDVDPAIDRLRLAEEEVPRDGVIVTRTIQSARTVGGGTAMWIGRRVRTGQGEGSSGLRFDTALPPGAV